MDKINIPKTETLPFPSGHLPGICYMTLGKLHNFFVSQFLCLQNGNDTISIIAN